MTTGRSLLLALAAGIAGVLLGAALPRRAASPRLAPPVAAPISDCNAARAELSSTRAQLTICLAYRPMAPEPTAPSSPTVPTQPAAEADAAPSVALGPPDPTGGSSPLAVEARKFGEQLDRYPEAVLVREKGTIGIYRPDEWPPDSAQIVGRKFLDGRIGWYAGPDAGARSDPAAFARMRDLAGPDGTVTMGGVRFQFAKPDGGAP